MLNNFLMKVQFKNENFASFKCKYDPSFGKRKILDGFLFNKDDGTPLCSDVNDYLELLWNTVPLLVSGHK